MIKLAKYLKPFSLLLVICVALLFGQAVCDLTLPNLMSDIVNVGLQQSGIKNSTPEAISKKGLDFISTFMSTDEKNTITKNYTLISAADQNSQGYKDNINNYPLLKTEDIYVLNSNAKETTDKLNPIFGKASLTFINIIKQVYSQNTSITASSTDMSNMDISKVYQMLPLLKTLPTQSLTSARATADNTPESMLIQTGVVMVKSFYKELGMDIWSIQGGYILKIGLLMILVALISGCATIMVAFLSSRIAAGLSKALRRNVFKKVEGFSNNEFDKFSTASLITRTTNDITQIQLLLVFGIRMVFYAPILAVGGIFMALQKSISMSWIIALAVVVLIGLVMTVFSIALPKIKIAQKLIDRLNLVTRENLSGLMVIRAFGSQKFEEKRFDDSNKELTNNNLFITRVMIYMMPIMMLIMNGITLLVVWVGAHQIAASNMQVGDMMAFMQYAMQVIMSFLMISMMFIMVPRASVSGDRISEVLDTESSINDPQSPQTFNNKKTGLIEFKNVSFRYDGAAEDVLHDISFVAKPGQTTSFIGSTGSGKTTLINLIPRFYDASSGEILVSGTDVKECTQHDLREQIGYIPQKGVLFSGTIDSNLRYGKKEATNDEIKEASETAQALDFINQTEKGFDSDISQNGTNVSGGQKQRLSIARALVKKPPIYIFDDSFSALDFKTDYALRQALKKYTSDSTVLIVAQRVSTIMNSDQIIVLDNGSIVGIGTHKELLESCPTYYEIASSQLSKEELR